MPRDATAIAAALKRRLAQMPAAVKAEVVKATNQNADDMVALAQRLAPTLKSASSKRTAGALKASIHKEPGDNELSVKVVAGNEEVFYPRFVEFGTRPSVKGQVQSFAQKLTLTRGTELQARSRKAKRTHPGTKAQPFFFPAYRALKKSMKARVARASTKAIKAGAGK